MAVGKNGAILQSGPIFRLSGGGPLTNGGFALTLTGQIGRSYQLQAESNLTGSNWSDAADFTNNAESMQVLDNGAAGVSQRFYRVVTP